MNLSDLYIVFLAVGVAIIAFPHLLAYPLFAQTFLHPENSILLFKISIGLGSMLIGFGAGCGVGHVVYRKKKGGKDDE